MQSKDLRIGNLILFHEDSTVFELEEICDGGYSVKNKEEATWIEKDMFSGIKITEDYFNKFKDIRKVSEEKYFIPMPKIKAELHLVWFMKSWVVELHHEHSNLPIVLNTEFLHELQNLYFALTGEELELKHESKP
jgi:hypothetical protein